MAKAVIRQVIKQIKGLVKRSDLLRSLLYDSTNEALFTDLRSHERMLNDSVRVKSYRAAIERAIKPGDTVIDLGTGTGILSMFAAACGPKRVYAIDHSEIIELAKRIAARNGIENISFVRANSRDFKPEELATVILHEQMGDSLFDENMVENLLDLKRRTLRPGGKILPGRFELYIEPACLKSEFRTPLIWEVEVDGVDLSFLRSAGGLESYTNDVNYQRLYVPTGGVSHWLCDPAPAVAVDLNHPGVPDLPKAVHFSRNVARAGYMDGVCVYFRVIFDDEISFDTSPFSPPTNWGIRFFRSERRSFAEGSQLEYTMDFGDITDTSRWRFTIH